MKKSFPERKCIQENLPKNKKYPDNQNAKINVAQNCFFLAKKQQNFK